MKKNLSYIFIAIAVIAAASNLIQKINYSPDDTYIYLQYARNIAAGNGFAFNAGEPSYGITSPVWSVILASGFYSGIDGYWFAKFVDLFLLVLSVIMFYLLSGMVLKKYYADPDTVRNLQLLSVSAFLLNTWLIRWSFTGMETSLAVLLIITFFYLLYKEKFYLSFTVLGFLSLVRPESFVLFILSFLYLIFNKTSFRKILTSVLLYGIIVSLFLLYAWKTFGTIFPNTTLGKATFSIGLSVYFEEIKKVFQTLALSNIVELLLSFIFIFFVLRKSVWKQGILMILWPCGLVFLYMITDADIISRYLLVIIPMIILCGITMIGQLKSKQLPVSILVFLVILIQSQFVFYKYVKTHTDNFSYGILNCLMETGKWLNANTPKDSRILVNDVGAIGYYSNRYIIDAAALINRDLVLNKKIMSTPVDQRGSTANLLKFIKADYLVQRDSSKGDNLSTIGSYKLQYIFEKEFPSLGITDPSPRYYKTYKITEQTR